MAQGMSVGGTGIVSWTFTADDRSEIEVCTHAYYVPNLAARLLSPQRLLNKKTGIFGKLFPPHTMRAAAFQLLMHNVVRKFSPL
jgi:hypothetical protein